MYKRQAWNDFLWARKGVRWLQERAWEFPKRHALSLKSPFLSSLPFLWRQSFYCVALADLDLTL